MVKELYRNLQFLLYVIYDLDFQTSNKNASVNQSNNVENG